MKKNYLLMLTFGLCAFALNAQDIDINATNFPDDNFREYVKKFDTTVPQDGKLSKAERDNVKEIRVDFFDSSPSSIPEAFNFKGIEHFTKLKKLSVRGDYGPHSHKKQIELDLSKNTALTELTVRGTNMTKLDLSKNTALTELTVRGTNMTKLDLSNNTALTKLNLYRNELTELDLSKNTALTKLDVHSNRLTALGLSKNTALTELDVHSNHLTTLDLSNNTALTKLDVHSNRLTALGLSKNTALTELDVHSNHLTTLDLSNNTALTKLYVQYNRLAELNVSNNTALTELDVHSNHLTTLDLSNNTALTNLGVSGNKLTALDLSGIGKLTQFGLARNQLLGVKGLVQDIPNLYISKELLEQQRVTIAVIKNADVQYESVNEYEFDQVPTADGNTDFSYNSTTKKFTTKTLDTPIAFKTKLAATTNPDDLYITGTITFKLDKNPEPVVPTFVTILTHPTNTSVKVGESASFTVTVDPESAIIQWQLLPNGQDDNEANWQNISGATQATLTLDNVTLDQSGNKYRAVATKGQGKAISNNAILIVTTDNNASILNLQGEKYRLELYPNPLAEHQELTIKHNINPIDYRDASIEIYSLHGQLIEKRAVNGPTVILNLKNKGIYLVCLKSKDFVDTKKLIVK